MLNDLLLKILVCPEDKSSVALLPAERIAEVNDRISRGEMRTRSGSLVTERIDGGLLRADGRFLYPIREEIPVMLIDEALSL